MNDRFSFIMPGQPPSWNHMYGRRQVRLDDGRMVSRPVKTSEVNLYQSQLTMIARSARPSDFQPTGQLLVVYEMELLRDLDADNVQKVVHDALAHALDVNDKRFLPVVLTKTHGHKNPQIAITVCDAERWRVEVVQ